MIANWIISFATGVKLHDYGCSLKVFRAEVVKPMKLYGEMHRFLPAIAAEQGVDIVEHVVNHRARVHGKSKYGISRTRARRARLDDGEVPRQLFDAAAPDVRDAGVLDGRARGTDLPVARLREVWPAAGDRRSATPAVGSVLLIDGCNQLVTNGLIAEMLSRTYHESQNKPIYAIREIRETKESEREIAAVGRR